MPFNLDPVSQYGPWNSIDSFRDYWRLTTEQINDSEVKWFLQNANDEIYLRIGTLTDKSFPVNDTERWDRINNLLKIAELELAMADFLHTTTYYGRTAIIDKNILSVLNISRGADTPSPIECANYLHSEAEKQIERAQKLLKLCKPKIMISSKMTKTF